MNQGEFFDIVQDDLLMDDIWVSPEEWITESINEPEDITLPEFYELKESPITMHQLHYISNKKNYKKKQKKVLQHDISVLEDQHCPPENQEEQHADLELFQDWLCFPNHDDEPIENKDIKKHRRKSLAAPLNEHDMNKEIIDTNCSLIKRAQ